MTATTEVVISEKSKLEFLRSDLSGIARSRMSTMRIGSQSILSVARFGRNELNGGKAANRHWIGHDRDLVQHPESAAVPVRPAVGFGPGQGLSRLIETRAEAQGLKAVQLLARWLANGGVADG